jgi:hypothetical protein
MVRVSRLLAALSAVPALALAQQGPATDNQACQYSFGNATFDVCWLRINS